MHTTSLAGVWGVCVASQIDCVRLCWNDRRLHSTVVSLPLRLSLLDRTATLPVFHLLTPSFYSFCINRIGFKSTSKCSLNINRQFYFLKLKHTLCFILNVRLFSRSWHFYNFFFPVSLLENHFRHLLHKKLLQLAYPVIQVTLLYNQFTSKWIIIICARPFFHPVYIIIQMHVRKIYAWK